MGKRKAEKKYKRKVDPVAVQVSIRVPRLTDAKGKRLKLAPAVIQQAILAWADTGEAPTGMEIAGVEWENYGRGKERRYAEDEEEIERARHTLNLGALFRGRLAHFSPVRVVEGIAQERQATVGFRPAKRAKAKPAVRGATHTRTKSKVVPARPNKKRVARGHSAKRKTPRNR